ncbi:hypothetical protein [Fredinandcohnia sp. 179-A 10B2 NHS]|uniref:hypothetical protein n=1 Tax=Fredinandcohnia sp. 179-A 10B2 NHS TaxID=3235176 RepID=UPI0039A2C7DF
MKWMFAIALIFIGAILFSLTIDQLGDTGHIVMKVIGFSCILIAPFIVRRKRAKNN